MPLNPLHGKLNFCDIVVSESDHDEKTDIDEGSIAADMGSDLTYAKLRAMGDADSQKSPHHSKEELTAGIRTVFQRDDAYQNPSTGQLQKSHRCKICFQNKSKSFFFTGGAHNFNVKDPQFIDNSRSGLNGIQYLAQNIAPSATHDSGNREICHPGTREDILQDILNWALNDNDNQKNIYWLHGSAGVGKTAIMQTAAVRLQGEGKLGASFFFSRIDPSRSGTSRTFATVAYQLAISSESSDFRKAVEEKIEHDPSVVQQSMQIQWKKLVVEPFKKIYSDGVNVTTTMILIDGLDECENEKNQLDLLELLDEAEVEELPLRIIICSRPESHIQDSILKDKAFKSELHQTHQVDAEMHLFLRDKLQELSKHRKFSASISSVAGTWPSYLDLDTLVAKASGQYIYATTVLRYVELGREGTIVTRLQQIIKLKNAHKLFSDLDILYQGILSKCPPITFTILGYLYILLREIKHTVQLPTLSVVNQLLQLNPGEIVEALETLHSLIYIPDLSLLSTWDIAEPHFHHASLEDFLTSRRRSATYFIDNTEIYQHFINSCKDSFKLMLSGPHVHKPTKISAGHMTCNFFGCFYALSKWFDLRRSQMEGLVLDKSASAWILDDTPLVQ
ncbi:hypothetical protein BDQ17DRAFT_1435848 [Cyathus striatus]|nr:hypothetical protein BDQ17DRAFT_1435848 [Cyathus striatus]